MINTFNYIGGYRTIETAIWDSEDEQSCKDTLHLLLNNVVPLETLRKLDFGSLNLDKEFDEYFKQPE